MVFGSKYDKYESLEPTYPAFQLRIAEDLRVVEADALPSALDKSMRSMDVLQRCRY